MTWGGALLAALAALVGASVVGAFLATRRWTRGVERWTAEVDRIVPPASPTRHERIVGRSGDDGPPDAPGLPDPVRRYAARAFPPGAPVPGIGRLRQEGHFLVAGPRGGWRPFEATATLRVHDPALLWDARIRMAPLVTVRVLDAYVDGRATMQARLGGLVTVADVEGGPGSPVARADLARYLAEAVWIPPRLALDDGLTWRPVDDRSAEATLRHGPNATTLVFTFDAAGDPVAVAGLRMREVEGDFVERRWVGRFFDHQDVGGLRIPTRAEVGWVEDGAVALYWKGRITSADYR